MRKYFYVLSAILFCLISFSIQAQTLQSKRKATIKKPAAHYKKFKPYKVVRKKAGGEGDENETEDGIKDAQQYEFDITHDPKTNTIPKERLLAALAQRNQLLKNAPAPNGANGTSFVSSTISTLTWDERGPSSDVAGAYGNPRDNNDVTGGRVAAFWNDLDPTTPNRVFVGGIDGGLWTNNDITNAAPTWTVLDNFSNLAISSICQDPTHLNIMYFGTGEKTYNADAVRGGGVWKSTDHGATWTLLANTTSFYNVSKILCDNAGNVYVGTIRTGGVGLQRSTDGGSSWTNITPTVGGMATTTVSDMVYDASTDRLHVYMGYAPVANVDKIGYCYGTGSTVTSSTWSVPTAGSGVAIITAPAANAEQMTLLAARNGIVWAIRGNVSNMVIYRSVDGGDNWTQQSSLTAAAYGVGQDWYSMGVDCDPANATASTNNIIFGNLNVFKSVNGGVTVLQVAEWVTGNYAGQTQYVHADVHNVSYGNSRIIVCSDGGVFYSADVGATWRDRNTGLRIKQFYSCAVNPTDPNYYLAGAQDNGVHQFTQAGLGSSTEVNGGDGAIVAIDQLNPTNQVGSYVYNTYNISVDNGRNWSGFTFGSNAGQFINPFDIDNKTKKMYAAYTAGNYLRWDDPFTTQTTTATIAVPAFSGKVITAMTVSPNLSNTIYAGIGSGIVVKISNANTATPTFTTITPPGSVGSVSSIDIGPGTADNDLIVTSSTYGVSKVFISADGGTGWTDITGTSGSRLPDMPVRWAAFYPGSNTQILLATEAGIWYTTATAGAATAWAPSAGFPAVRSDMIRYNPAQAIFAVGTHGRGLWTTKINTQPKVSFAATLLSATKKTTATIGCRSYKDYTTNLFISDPPTGTATVTLSPQTGGTAVLGTDYDFTTNGSFTSPSNVATFASGTYPNTIPVTFRIYDTHDNNAPQPQTAVINIAVTGTTDAIANPVNSIYTLSLTDVIKPAIVPAIPATAQTIWSENWTSAPSYANWTFLPDVYNQTLPNVNAFIPFYSGCANNISTTTAELLATDATGQVAACGNGFGGASTAMFYRAVNAGGKNAAANMTVTFGYRSAGGANGITNSLLYSTDGGTTWTIIASYGTSNATTTVTTPIPASLNNSNFLLGWRFTATAATPANTLGFSVDNIIVKGDVIENPIEITAGATTSLYTAKNQSIDYYSAANNNIMANVANPSADLGCVTATVETAGNTWQVFQGGLRSQKTFLITAAQNAGSSYNATLFFTNAELAGLTPSTLKIAKTSAASFAAADGSNTVVVTPTTTTYSTSGVAFTGSFTGFSRFALINNFVALPITLIEFKGTLVNGQGLLQWSTSVEIDSKNFEIERSGDGINFYKIGTVNAAGNHSGISSYTFTDDKLSAVNYYRLRMNDTHGKSSLSNTVLIRYTDVKQHIYVVNNPFSANLNIRLTEIPSQKVLVQLFDEKGSKVYDQNFSSATEINVPNLSSLAAGNYILKTTVDGFVYTNKVVKK